RMASFCVGLIAAPRLCKFAATDMDCPGIVTGFIPPRFTRIFLRWPPEIFILRTNVRWMVVIWLLHYSIPVLCLSFPKIRDSASALLEPPLKVFIQGASLEVFVVKKAGRTLAGFDWFHIRHYASTYRHFPDCYRRRGRMNVRWMVGMVMMMMTWII